MQSLVSSVGGDCLGIKLSYCAMIILPSAFFLIYNYWTLKILKKDDEKMIASIGL